MTRLLPLAALLLALSAATPPHDARPHATPTVATSPAPVLLGYAPRVTYRTNTHAWRT